MQMYVCMSDMTLKKFNNIFLFFAQLIITRFCKIKFMLSVLFFFGNMNNI